MRHASGGGMAGRGGTPFVRSPQHRLRRSIRIGLERGGRRLARPDAPSALLRHVRHLMSQEQFPLDTPRPGGGRPKRDMRSLRDGVRALPPGPCATLHVVVQPQVREAVAEGTLEPSQSVGVQASARSEAVTHRDINL